MYFYLIFVPIAFVIGYELGRFVANYRPRPDTEIDWEDQ